MEHENLGESVTINVRLVQRLIAKQFPLWRNLTIQPVPLSGWDNRTFHLGDNMLVRLPSAEKYALQVEKEHNWLPKLAPLLPLSIPVPLAMGIPGAGYPWKWSIYRWLEGESAATAKIADLYLFAASLAQFLLALHSIDSVGGPPPGCHSFYRGGELKNYDAEVKRAIGALNGKMDVHAANELWEEALSTSWQRSSVWVHGDISAGNLLVKDGNLCAVIDFGQLTVGDPACDLAIAWTMFNGKSREIFRSLLALDKETWLRGRAWTL